MKKILALILAFAMVACVAGCSKSEGEPAESKNNSSVSEKENNEEATENETENETVAEVWGKKEQLITINENKSTVLLSMRVPTTNTSNVGPGMCGYQEDGTIVLFGGLRSTASGYKAIESIDKMFPAYFDQTIEIVENFRRDSQQYDLTDYAFKLTAQENIKINDYEMCKYTGVHTYTEENRETGEYIEKSMNFVSYATRVKGNNQPVYWMVLDNSEDQSLGELIEANALNMAKTLQEEKIN